MLIGQIHGNVFNNNTVANVGGLKINNIFPSLKNRFTILNYFSFLFRTEKMNVSKLYHQYNPETKEIGY